MTEIQTRIKKWNEDRNLLSYGFDSILETRMLEEEYKEYLNSKDIDEKIDALCDLVVVAYGALFKLNETEFNIAIDFSRIRLDKLIDGFKMASTTNESVDYLSSLIALCEHNIDLLGYNYKCCMNETLLEIESRVGAINVYGKFEKDKSQNAMNNWYKARYDKCKIKDK